MIGRPGTRNLEPTVLITADAIGGVWSYATRLCRALPGTRFVVAMMGPRPQPAQRDEISSLENTTLVESSYSLEWMANGGADFAESSNWLTELADNNAVDVVHLNGYAHAILGADWPVLVVAHSDVLSWWQAVHKQPAPPEWDRYRRRTAAGLAAATRIVAPTAQVLQDLEHHYMGRKSNTQVIPNGLDLAAYPPSQKASVVLAAGRVWDAAKNLAALASVAPDLAWPVEIAGEVEHPEGGVAGYSNVRLLGRLSSVEMTRHLGCASIFAAPALYEPFGLAILEAAASGCALVLGDIPCLRENWDGVAVFVDPDDRSALKVAINELIADPAKRNRVATAVRRRARQFTVSRMAQAYAALYREMARSSPRLRVA
jgi:glycogen synthase